MTEQHSEVEEQTAPQLSPGQTLRKAREAVGLTQQALADKLFLKVNIIQELEADEINPKTSVTFTKGYIRLYAKNVGIDPTPLLAAFDERSAVNKPPQKLQSFSRRVSKEANDDRWMMVTYAILAVVIALVVVWWYQQADNADISAEQSTTIPQSSAANTPDRETAIQAPETVNNTPTTVDQMQPADNQIVSNSDDTEQVLDQTLATDVQTDEEPLQQQNEPVIETNQQASNEVSADRVELVFTFSDDCWVNIVDATGEAIAYGVKTKGRVMPVSGYPPFAVTLGAPQVVAISYAGDAVDLSAIPAGRTARFDLPMQE